MTTCIYKVVRNIKHRQHGWIKLGRFVECRPEFAKNYVIRREMVRCSANKQDSIKPLWIDSEPKPKAKQKPVTLKKNQKPKRRLNEKTFN